MIFFITDTHFSEKTIQYYCVSVKKWLYSNTIWKIKKRIQSNIRNVLEKSRETY